MIFFLSFLLIGLNALFVMMEYSLIKIRPSRLEMLATNGVRGALAVQRIHAHFNQYIAAIQVGIAAISLTLGWIAEPALAQTLHGWLGGLIPARALWGVSFALALAALAWAQCVFGEIVPRAVGLQKAEALALGTAPGLELFTSLVRLPTAMVSFCAGVVLRILGYNLSSDVDSPFSQEEVRVVIGESRHGQEPLPLERLLLLENLFDFGKAVAKDVMIPREKVVGLPLEKTWPENRETVRKSGFSRYPLLRGSLDDIAGMVHVKDILLKTSAGQNLDLLSLRRDIESTHELEPLENLLRRFSKKGTHMAVVRAEPQPGALPSTEPLPVLGLLTLEDILEELVGEVRDEFDHPETWSFKDSLVSPAILIPLPAQDRLSAIQNLSKSLARSVPGLNAEEVWRTVWERESKFPTSIGKGIALPHGRMPHLDRSLVAVGRLAKPIDYPSPDHVPVRLIFLILTPTAVPALQLKVLGRIATLASNENLLRRMMRAKNSEALLEILRTADTLLAL